MSKLTGKCKSCPNDFHVCMYCNASGAEKGVSGLDGICQSCGMPRKY
jgi:hypothetical protein